MNANRIVDWQAELARIELERLPRAARRLVLEIAAAFRREDAESAAYSGTAPSPSRPDR